VDPAIEIETGEAPKASVVVLHGLGADGGDFVPIAEELDLAAVGPVRFVFPHAPMRPVTVNGGYVMRAWYDILGFGGTSREDEAGLRASREAVDLLIAREVERGVPAARIVVAGFSQGCAMALMTGVRHPERLAGVAGMSGYLPLAAATAAERSEANRDVPIFLAHGTREGGGGEPRRAADAGVRGRLACVPDRAHRVARRDPRPGALAASRARLKRAGAASPAA